MSSIKHILFPYDFSEQAQLAAPFVRAVAGRFESRITLMSVVPPVWDVPSPGMPAMIAIDIQEIERDLKCRLEGALTKELAGLPVQRVTDGGDPAYKITEFAHSHAVDLLMMPTHGCGLFRSLLIGSVTAKVLHDANCPVWTATHAEEQRSRDVPKTILCALDSTDKSVPLMQRAAEFNRQMGATLKLVHVVLPISDWLALPSERDLQEEVREEARAKVDALRQSAGVDLPIRVAVGNIADTVTEEARQEGADLVIIGRGSLQATLGRLRTHAYGIIQKSPCPVLSI
jgi:nucleotide-binding universal stress UspA family protein